ncbi:MAG: phosphoribosylformylglycinamidine synthase subunit PurL [Candidatus Omnitrophota bacterium]
MKKEVYRSLGLSDSEYKHILELLGRKPSPTELAMFSVEWSEHCGYPRSRGYLKLLPKKGKYKTLIGEDAGGIIVDDLAIIFKMESHNHPSQVEPKQGAATGVGGIIRDIFTSGARPIACLDSLRFGMPDNPQNRYIIKGVIDGIQHYGNCVGVPTVGGEVYFDENYAGNCLVNAMCIGVCSKDKIARARAQGIGNSIMYVGSTTGRDGIGGCSVLASAEFKEGEEKRPTVQIGDPFMEKCLIEATLEALETGYIIGIKDMGAAGLTCSTSEMAFAGGVGIDVELEKVPRREPNMEPWEVMMSESQERMLVCIKAGKEKEIEKIFTKWDLNAAVIGKVTDNGIVRIRDKGKIVCEVPSKDLADAPLYNMPYKKPKYLEKLEKLNYKAIKIPKDYNQILLELLSSPTICNKAYVYEQYDHMVQANTVVMPGSDAAVLRIKGTKKAISATTDCNSRYCFLNPKLGAQIAIAEAARNLVCSGADPAAITDCLNFGNPEKPDRYWHFKNCIEGIIKACKSFNIPVVSGNVSFYNESPKGAIYPTPGIGMIGIIKDINKHCTQGFKNKDNAVILLGKTLDELGASEYLKVIHKKTAGGVPRLNLDLEKRVQKTVLELIEKGLVNSAHDCSEGGLAIAIVESCISNKECLLGAEISLYSRIRPDALLFGESQSRIVISCDVKNIEKIRKIARKTEIPLEIIGKVSNNSFKVSINSKIVINLSKEVINNAWRDSLTKNLTKGD